MLIIDPRNLMEIRYLLFAIDQQVDYKYLNQQPIYLQFDLVRLSTIYQYFFQVVTIYAICLSLLLQHGELSL